MKKYSKLKSFNQGFNKSKQLTQEVAVATVRKTAYKTVNTFLEHPYIMGTVLGAIGISVGTLASLGYSYAYALGGIYGIAGCLFNGTVLIGSLATSTFGLSVINNSLEKR